jgi:CHASE3 domain sensor protein
MSSIRSLWGELKEGLSRTTLTSTIPLALVVAAGALLSYRSHLILRRDRDLVIHTYQTLGAAQAAVLAAANAETAERGFIITGDPAFLVPYDTARNQSVPDALGDLTRLVADNPAQQERLGQLRRLLAEEFNEIRSAIEVRRTRNFEDARLLIESQAPKRITDQIRGVVSQLDAAEEALLNDRSRRVRASEERILMVGALTAAVSLLTRLLIAIRAARVKQAL